MAVADANRMIRRAPYRVTFVIRNSNTGNPITAATGLDPEISKDGGTFTNTTNSPTEIATSSGVYFVDLTAAEMTADQLVFKCSSTSANAVTAVAELIPEPALDSGVVAGVSATTLTLQSAAPAFTDRFVGALVEIVRGTGAGQVRCITDYTSGRVATLDRAWDTNPDTNSVYRVIPTQGVPVSQADGVPKANITQLNDNATAAANLERLYKGGLEYSTVLSATSGSVFRGQTADLAATDDWYNNALLVFTSGTLAGLAQKIGDFTGSTREFSMTASFPATPAVGDSFIILGHFE